MKELDQVKNIMKKTEFENPSETTEKEGEGTLASKRFSREQVTLDFSACKSIVEVYNQMCKTMEWKDWYGFNLDALWDILTGLPYKGDDFVIRRPRVYSEIPHGKNREFTEAVDKICQVFEEAQTTYGEITVNLEYTNDTDPNPNCPVEQEREHG